MLFRVSLSLLAFPTLSAHLAAAQTSCHNTDILNFLKLRPGRESLNATEIVWIAGLLRYVLAKPPRPPLFTMPASSKCEWWITTNADGGGGLIGVQWNSSDARYASYNDIWAWGYRPGGIMPRAANRMAENWSPSETQWGEGQPLGSGAWCKRNLTHVITWDDFFQ
jgi:hypothetical protein